MNGVNTGAIAFASPPHISITKPPSTSPPVQRHHAAQAITSGADVDRDTGNTRANRIDFECNVGSIFDVEECDPIIHHHCLTAVTSRAADDDRDTGSTSVRAHDIDVKCDVDSESKWHSDDQPAPYYFCL